MKRELLLPLLLVACGGGGFDATESAAEASGVADAGDTSEDAGTWTYTLPDIPWVAPTAEISDAADPDEAQDTGADLDVVPDAAKLSAPFIAGGWQCNGSAEAGVPTAPAEAGDVLHCSAKQYPLEDSWAALSTKGGSGEFPDHESITFWACGEGIIRVEIPTVRREENAFGILVELTNTWQQYRISWAGESTDLFNPETAYGLYFWLNSPWHADVPAYDLWVDEVEFAPASTPLGTSEVPCK